MLRFKGYITEMATFSPKNFPSGVGNNRDFPGAGERTTYAPEVLNQYKFKDGFKTSKATPMYNTKGEIAKQLPQGTTVHFTVPAALVRSTDIGITRRTTLAPVSLKGFDQNPDGLVAISAIVKPSGNSQQRVGAGSKTQDMVAQHVKDMAFKKGIEVEDAYKTAPAGSTIPDLVMTIAKKKIQFEIKGTNNRTAPITFFDKSVRRQGKKPELLEDMADVYIEGLKIKGKTIKSAMGTKYPKTFVGIIDFYKNEVDPTIGLAGDEGTVKSGKLPTDFVTTDRNILSKMHKIIIDHFDEGGDDYFVVHNRSGDNFEVYFVGKNKSQNVLKAPALPAFTRFALATYGGASGGATRVGLKIKF